METAANCLKKNQSVSQGSMKYNASEIAGEICCFCFNFFLYFLHGQCTGNVLQGYLLNTTDRFLAYEQCYPSFVFDPDEFPVDFIISHLPQNQGWRPVSLP
jgi:hypothetical protein